MLVDMIFIVCFVLEISIAVIGIKKQTSFRKQKVYIRLLECLVWLVLIVSPIIQWGFMWYGISIWLIIVTLMAVVGYLRNRDKEQTKKKTVVGSSIKVIVSSLLIGIMLIPAALFPQDNTIEPTGNYGVQTVSYTWEDETREEYFTEETDHRKITVQFWYPTMDQEGKVKAEGEFPLVVFSHGAMGIRLSNFSTYTELASHGYVVCSIDHTYHSFITMQTDGKKILADQEFLGKALGLTDQEKLKESVADSVMEEGIDKYETIQEWQKLRVEDMSFCINQIKAYHKADTLEAENEVFGMIDCEHIGVMGHSLGGSAAAGIGRTMEGIKAVAVIDGTMLGEEIGYENGMEIITHEPYPVPILNFYNGATYKEILAYEGEYPNFIASQTQPESYNIVVTNAGHLNFTDLAIISPALASILGTGEVEAKPCLEFMNETLLEFFDGYLKGEEISLPKEQSITI